MIWVGINEGGDRVKYLAEKIEVKLGKEGYKGEEMEFSSHLTIGSIKEKIDINSLNIFIKNNENADFGGFIARNISLMKSTLRRSGPIYEEIKRIELSS